MYDITDFLVHVIQKTQFGAVFNEKVTIHESCSALREYGLTNEPRLLLEQVQGIELIDLPDSKTCCGFGGTFSAKHTAISSAWLNKKFVMPYHRSLIYYLHRSSCLMNIAGYISKNKIANYTNSYS
jgi:L-lactate dehydrogenase complex protein LldE